MRSLDAAVVAERFVRDRHGWWIDAATGEPVCLRVLPALSLGSHARWLERSASLFGLWHPHLAVPDDFGVLPDGRRFEALPVAVAPSPGEAGARRAAFDLAAAFLGALGRTAGRPAAERVGLVGGRLALVCDGLTGWLARPRPDTRAPAARAPAGAAAGVILQPRAAMAWVVGLMDAAEAGQPRSLTLRAAPGAGWRTLRRALAREARLRGFVPVDARAAAARLDLARLVAGRHVLLFDDRRAGASDPFTPGGSGVADVLLRLGVHDLRGCVVVTVVDGPDPDAIDLDPLPASALGRMVVGGRTTGARLHDLARRAGGNPGRFLALIGGHRATRWRPVCQPHLVRETMPAYRTAASDDAAAAGAAGPAPGESRLLARRRRAAALVLEGRHAASIRLMRALVRAYERRGDANAAADVALALGAQLLARGRSSEAVACLERAAQSRWIDVRLRAAATLAAALTDRGDLARAEGVARAAAMVARREDRAGLEAAACLALSRALFWQGRYRDAAQVLTASSLDAPEFASANHLARARVALLQGRVADAWRSAAAARSAASASGSTLDLARSEAMMAALSAALSDAETARARLAASVGAARRARSPMAGLLARLETAEAWARGGRTAEAQALARPLWRRAKALPPLVLARVGAVLGATGDRAAQAAAGRFAAVSGAVLIAQPEEIRDMDVIQEATGIMAACQEAESAEAALSVACRQLAERLRARGVAIVARDQEVGAILARIGPEWSCLDGCAARVLTTGATVAPRLGAGGLEGAAPIRYGGRTIGAVACRWPADARAEGPRAAALMEAAATACAPALRAALDARLAGAPTREGAGAALLGESQAIERVRQLIARVAQAPFAALIEGESGTGKELVARLVHETGPRRGHRFCAVNCAAIGDDLLEAELFGHTRGAFTGAVAERPGLFEEADRGTLLLDEVSELTPRAQAKLLRVIQEGEVRRLGENLPRRVDVRIVAATNRALEPEVRAGRFRADLRYRLDVIRIEVPPLRDRIEDVPVLASHFWRQVCARIGSRLTLDPETLAVLARYDWPGNVRELQNVMASLAVHGGSRGRARADALPAHIARAGTPAGGTLDEARASFERRFVRAALARAGGHRGRAARQLGMSRQGLAKLLKRLELEATG